MSESFTTKHKSSGVWRRENGVKEQILEVIKASQIQH